MKTSGSVVLLLALATNLSLTAARVTAQTFNRLHTFTSTSGPNATNMDGASPSAALVLSGDVLYGTTVYGGTSGRGAVFAIKMNGADLTTLHSFTGGNDGANPYAELIVSNNTLYGTTTSGGGSGAGTIFSLDKNGAAFTTLHAFTATVNDSFNFYTNSDGAHPSAGVLLSDNVLYGSTDEGGTSGRGTVFALNSNGTGFATLHSFTSGSGGTYSSAGLRLLGNTLYGTDYRSLGNGTVFAISTDGAIFTNHYAFSAGNLNGNGVLTNSDGANPHSKLILSGNTLYGTTEHGGQWGNGTVFAINNDGTGFINLHSFSAGGYNRFGLYTNSDGITPSAGLILSGANLYGTAAVGGSSGHGTVFMLKTDGTGFTNLYNFTATPPYPQQQTNSDGANPYGSLLLSSNSLYGTASSGGSAGNGTIFKLSFTPRLAILTSRTNVVLTWPSNAAGFDYSGYKLQSAPAVSGAFTNIPGATSPYVQPVGSTPQFFRLSQ
jgi:uncharacterized repeat protein (TIGR03803 family)